MFVFRLSLDEFYFSVDIPWPRLLPWYNNTWALYKSKKISKNKSLEVQIECDWDTLFEFTIQLNRCTDHAGFNFTLAFLKHWININFIDNRHWNYEKNRWYNDTDYDDLMFTTEQANAKITEIAQKIKSGIEEDEIKKLLEELPHYEMKYALIGKLAEWHYSTVASRVAQILWNNAREKSWWFDIERKAKEPNNG